MGRDLFTNKFEILLRQFEESSNFGSLIKPNLKDINFSLKLGEITAIVGLSGSGKSSILDLLIGLFEPNCGNIFIY